MALSTAETEQLLSAAHIGVLGSVDRTGRPHQVPIWYLWRDGAVLMLTDRSSRKWRNLLANPSASFCVDTKVPPYQAVILEGEVSEAPDQDYRGLLREMAVHYLGEREGNRYADGSTTGDPDSSVVFRLTPSGTVSWGY